MPAGYVAATSVGTGTAIMYGNTVGTGGTTSLTYTSDTWDAWATGTTTGTTSATFNYQLTNVVWQVWNDVVDSAHVWSVTSDGYRRTEVDPERLAEQRRQQEQVNVDRRAAETRAEALLMSLLSDEQRATWAELRAVDEVAPSGQVWRLYDKRVGGAALLNEDGVGRRATLCVHVGEAVPNADNVVALLMMLRSGAEDDLIRTANLHGGEWTAREKAVRMAAVGARLAA